MTQRRSVDSRHDMDACVRLMRGGSKSFFAASLVLPRRVRDSATALYAFCRVADDAIDLSSDRSGALAELHERLAAIYAGQPRDITADRAFAAVVEHHGIPRELPEALLDGFRWDAEGRRYETIGDLEDYGARVAGTVGAMMALVMHTRSERALARACELGVAMQLTNIARDVGEDARNGRLYLPLAWMREAGIDPDQWLANPVFDPALASVIERLISAADRLYRRAEAGIRELPRDCRPAIQAARLVYAEIGRGVERAGFDSVSVRAVIPGRRKAALVARAMGAALTVSATPAVRGLAPIPAVQYLVNAAACDTLPLRSFYDRTVRVVDLFERVAQRNRIQRSIA